MTCPGCEGEASKVIYMGFPMKICTDPACATLFGVFSMVPVWFPVTTEMWDGPTWAFFTYEGRYLPALWRWLKGGA